jgi:hypothetical protein
VSGYQLGMPLLKIIALEPTDVPVLSAHLQDAVAKVGDIAYIAHDQRLVLQVNRFNWGAEVADKGDRERRLAVLRIDRVTHVQSRGVDRDNPASVLAILTALFKPDPDPALAPTGTLTIVCAGGATLQLTVECVELVLEDIGPAWAARGVPEHSKD